MAKKSTKSSKKEQSPPKQTGEVRGFLLVTSSMLIILSLLSFAMGHETQNVVGLIGYSVGWIFHAIFGLSSYLVAAYAGWVGWRMLFNKSINYPRLKLLYLSLMVISLCMLLNLIENSYPSVGNFVGQSFYSTVWQKKVRYHLGGAPFYYILKDLPGFNLLRMVNTTGVAIIFLSTFMASLLFFCKDTPSKVLAFLKSILSKREEIAAEATQFNEDRPPFSDEDPLRFVKLRIPQNSQPAPGDNLHNSPSQDMLAIQPEINPKFRPSLSRKELADDVAEIIEAPKSKPKKELVKREPEEIITPQKRRENALTAQKVYNGNFADFKIPSTNLLTNAKKFDQSSLKKDLKRQAEVLEETLLSFGIEAKVGQINCGPTITSFEVHPAIGVKVQKIKTLENDIALNMEAKSIRIIAPIPGKAAVGIEVPNAQPQEVSFKEMLMAYQQSGQKFHIPILLGKAVNGDYVMSDLTKMPHCIIAGATGSGKSVCINTIVMSILLNARPDEIKLVMVDPKKVELTPYTNLPHMLAPVITEPAGACAALHWMVKEMENRYEILKLIGARNIDAFNKRTVNKELEASLDREIPATMPYIVGIVDELADLMMVSSSDIETPIARIAQMARAVGIHLILATQRPSREVITGLIKANFPTRISFKVASRVNSQIVLDETGAETLLGNGDLLFLPPGTSHLVRAQGAYIRDEDINAVVKSICDQAPPNYVIQSFDKYRPEEGDGSSGSGGADAGDTLYPQAVDVVLSTGNASTTFLQRKLKIGYARAASLMDIMEQRGIVGPAEGAKPRKILQSRMGSGVTPDSDALFHSNDHD